MSITYEQLGVALKHIAREKSEWAGLPIPVDEFALRLEPRFPYQFHIDRNIDETKQTLFQIVNEWWSDRLRGLVVITEEENGKRLATIVPNNAVTVQLGTLGCSRVWLIEAEIKAMEKLRDLVGDWKFRCYMMTGSFLETSKRSAVTYMFRKLRPTLAIRNERVLCGLCLHSIGYYEGTWAGVMVPTDEVIAHLVMMRGDEHYFWRCANQHSPTHPNSGL